MNLIKYFLINLLAIGASASSEKDEFSTHISKPVHILISMGVGSPSHVRYLFEISKELVKQGHKITYAASTEKKEYTKGYDVGWYDMGPLPEFKRNRDYVFNFLIPIYDHFFPKLDGLIKKTEPDVVICDFFSNACIDYCQLHRIPVIVGMQPLDATLNPVPYVNNNAGLDIPVTTEKMSFWSRWYNTFLKRDPYSGHRANYLNKMNEVRAKYGVPKKSGLFGDIDTTYKIQNTYLGWEVPRPMHPSFELVGPIRSTNIIPLTEDLSKFLNQWDNVLYIAFGSYQTLTTKELELIIQASFKSIADGTINGVILATKTKKSDFPDEFHTENGIIKSKDIFEDRISNFKYMEHVPQEAILNHANTKLFISHGGLESTFESISTSTPILLMPFMGDQPINGQLVIENNLGGMFDKAKATYKTVSQEIKRIVADEDGSINRDIKRIRTIAHYNSIGVKQAGDKIVSFAKTAQACRTNEDLKNEIPCEMKSMTTVDQRIPRFKAYQYDIYVFHYTLITLIICTLVPLIFKYFRLSKYLKIARRQGYSLIRGNEN
jgi:UDP:flavonoid glycosyltransferase YjiC (YdhE family)